MPFSADQLKGLVLQLLQQECRCQRRAKAAGSSPSFCVAEIASIERERLSGMREKLTLHAGSHGFSQADIDRIRKDILLEKIQAADPTTLAKIGLDLTSLFLEKEWFS